jgi:hypothetical protein
MTTDSLDTAWAAAEAALPKGWWMELRGPTPSGAYQAESYHGDGQGFTHRVWNRSPAAALRALAERLREQQDDPRA